MPRPVALWLWRAIFVTSIVTGAAVPVRAQAPSEIPFEWHEAVHALADKIAPALPPLRSFSLDVKDITSTPSVDVSGVRRALSEQLRILGARQAEASPAEFQLQVTISRSAEVYLMVAEVTGAGMARTMIVDVANPEETATRPTRSPSIERKTLWRQSRPILDFAQADLDGGNTLWYLLEPDGVEMYEFSAGSQILHQVRPIAKLYASRDPRGRLDLTDATHITALLGGVECVGEWNPSFNLDCHENSGQQWLLGTARWQFDPRHDYFSGSMALSGGVRTRLPAFYWAATPPPETSSLGNSQWIISGIDGQTQLFAGAVNPVANFSGWGSDFLTVTLGCGSDWHVLTSGTGDWTQPDWLQLYEIKDRQALAEGQSLEVPGPVLAMWPARDGKSARVVVRNLETKSYEASMVTVSCGN